MGTGDWQVPENTGDTRETWSFGRWLQFLAKEHGVRPEGSPDKVGRPWTAKELADLTGMSARSIRYWLDDQKLPADTQTIERALFGTSKLFDDWRTGLRAALVRGRHGHAPAAPPAEDIKGLSNIAVRVPRHFLGRDGDMAALAAALARDEGRVAITALHGMRGVGKTTLAAAYAQAHRGQYRATWWIRSERAQDALADLVGLGVALGWVAADAAEQAAFDTVMARLQDDGERLLLIYDNAVDAASLRPLLPKGGAAQVIVTSNFHAWRGLAEPVEIRLWPAGIGADYLIARTGRDGERGQAEALSVALGGLPLAHEQAAAWCEQLGKSLGDYHQRFEAAPVTLLDDEKRASPDYADSHGVTLTVAKTFQLAIEAAGARHSAAAPLIALCALLPAAPIPLFFLEEGRGKLDWPTSGSPSSLPSPRVRGEGVASVGAKGLNAETAQQRSSPRLRGEDAGRQMRGESKPESAMPPFALFTLLAEDGLDEALAALAGFALIEREEVADERDPSITTPCIALHRLVRAVAAAPVGDGAAAHASLIKAMAAVAPYDVFTSPVAWQKCRRLEIHALALLESANDDTLPAEQLAYVCTIFAAYRQTVLGDFAAARPLYQRALAIGEKTRGPEHPDVATSLNNLAEFLRETRDFTAARPLYQRALAIRDNALGAEHPDVAASLNNFALLLRDTGDYADARPLFERALSINEKVYGAVHPNMATGLNNLATLLLDTGDFAAARPLYERAIAIGERTLGPEHPSVATSLNNLAELLRAMGDIAAARPLYERALAIDEKTLGEAHPNTNIRRGNLAQLLLAEGKPGEALPLIETALKHHEKLLGTDHPYCKAGASILAKVLDAL
jgi:tetratricopeptide (TPR) repeat protein